MKIKYLTFSLTKIIIRPYIPVLYARVNAESNDIIRLVSATIGYSSVIL